MTRYELESIPDVDDYSSTIQNNHSGFSRIRQPTYADGASNYVHTDQQYRSTRSVVKRKDTDLEYLCNQLDSVEMEDLKKRPREETGFNMKQNTSCRQPVYEDDFLSSDRIYSQDRDGDTLLHTAIILQELDLIFRCISKATSYRALSLNNLLFQTPLHLATLTDQPDVVRRLVVAGADLQSRDKDGNTALHIACRDGLIKIVKHLLNPVRFEEIKQNSYSLAYQTIPQDMKISNYEGVSCLHLAAINGHLDIVELLMDKDIDVNLRDGKTGRTILHNACLAGNINLVKLLLRHKSCNINARAYDDSTPFDLARATDHDNVCMALAAAGAKYGDENSDLEFD